MAQKRKAAVNDEGRSSKKARSSTAVPKSTRPKTVDTVPATEGGQKKTVSNLPAQTADTTTDKVSQVEWALPTKADNKTINDIKAITQFAPLISHRPWSQTRTMRVPFQSSPLRSPLYKKKGSPDLEADSDKNKSSHCVVRLFNRIKRCTESPNDDTLPVTYQRAAFERAFGTGDEQLAVVASTSSTDPIFTLSRDHQVDVTLRHETHRQDHARITFIRRQPPGASSDWTAPYAYFIVVPPQTKLTINGQTYVNDEPSEDETTEDEYRYNRLGSNLYIGPLQQFTVIELLSQPLFFFRTRADLDFTKRTAAKADAIEMSGRDRNGNVEEGITNIVWSLSNAPLQEPVSGHLGLRGQVEDSGDEQLTDDSGKMPGDPCGYLKRRLWASQHMHFDELIPRVLTSINHPQTPSSGFSFKYNGRTFRPGRTLITATTHQNYHVLLIVRQNEIAETELQILDPMAWRSKTADRKTLVTRANELIPRGSWRTAAAREQEGQGCGSPLPATWAPCAQRANWEEASTFTVLNAWAIALGLQVDPAFTPNKHGDEDFFTRAQWLFNLARRDLLDWKLLLAFFKCTRFVELGELMGDEGNHHLPPLDRRFKQSRRSFERAIAEQKEADDAKLAGQESDVAPCLAVRTGISKAHSVLFPADDISDELLNELPPFVNQGHWRLTESTEHLVERFNQFRSVIHTTKPPRAHTPPAPKSDAGMSKDAESGSTKHPAATTPTAPNESIEDPRLSQDFNACEFFHKEVTAKKALAQSADQSAVELSKNLALSSQDVFDSIGAVARALNRLQPPDNGITVFEPSLGKGKAIKSNSDPNIFTDKILLLPWQHDEHMLLIIAQSDSHSAGIKAPTCHIVDSAPWTLKQAERHSLHDAVVSVLEEHWRPGTVTDSLKIPPLVTWVFGPRQREMWQCRYYAIFNAWSFMLDCMLDCNFAPCADFFTQGRELVDLMRAGFADWKLVYSFLLCYGYVKQEGRPGEARRFPLTVDDRSDEGNQTRDKAAQCGYDFSKLVEAKMKRPHNFIFKNWDGWDKTDISVRLPALLKADMSPLRLDATQLRNAYHELITQPRQSTAEFASADKPCVYVKARLAALQDDEDTRQRLGSLRSKSSADTKAGQWLSNEEIALAIASVTLAITSIQDVSRGFSTISGMDVQLCHRTDKKANFGPRPVMVPRFGRPMFVPIVEANHIVLGVVQLDHDDRLTVSIVDSKSAHYSRATRAKVFQMVKDTAEGTGWWRKKFASWKDVPIPKAATWIPCAQQPGGDECGYSTILNSWALALGLELNPHAVPIWNKKAVGTDNLYQTVLDITHLARLGLVDWTLIYAFLRCHRFVHEGSVPRDRRFTNTVRLQDENELKERLENLVVQEMKHWTLETSDLNDIKGANAIQFSDELAHISFPEYGWGATRESVNLQKASALSALGHLHTRMSSAELGRFHRYFCSGRDTQTKPAGEQIGTDKATFFLNSLQWQRKSIKDISRENLLDMYRDFLSNARSQSSSLLRLQKRHCALAGEGLGLLRTLLANTELDKKLASGIPYFRSGEYLDLGEVNLAIAAVVEAIDNRQASVQRANSSTPFTGGFALATRNGMQVARAYSNADGIVSRPRRCFLLPMTIGDTDIQRHKLALMGKTEETDIDWRKADQNHHFLAVVQEESRSPTLHNPATSHFCVYTLDSAPQRFKVDIVQQLFHDMIRNTATNLGWAHQRNVDGGVRFRPQHSRIPVFPQTGGGWQCGLHTILYAWILALGLMPRSGPLILGSDFYAEFWVLVRAAVAGLLDWKTLVAWLFCHNMVTSRALASVPEDRRFETTRYQDSSWSVDRKGNYDFFGEEGLVVRVDRISTQDLADVSSTEVPYDYSNNVDFSEADSAVTAGGGDVTAASEEEEEDSEEEGPEESAEEGQEEESQEEEEASRSGSEGGPSESEQEEEQEEEEYPSDPDSDQDLSDPSPPSSIDFPPHTHEHLVLSQSSAADRRRYKAAPENQRPRLLDEFQNALVLQMAAGGSGSGGVMEGGDVTDQDAEGETDDEVEVSARCRILEDFDAPCVFWTRNACANPAGPSCLKRTLEDLAPHLFRKRVRLK